MTTFESPLDPTAAGYPPDTQLRPPGEGECEVCGFTPAAQVSFQSLTSIAILYTISTRRGWMCRSCGLATYRSLVSRTLLGGWWGVGLFGMPVILLMNRFRLRRVLRLQPPQRRLPDVAAAVPTPIDPGRRILARGSGIFATVICGAVLLLVLGTVLAEILGSQ